MGYETALVLAPMLSAIALFILGTRIKGFHMVLQVLFIFSGLLFITQGLSVGRNIAEMNNVTNTTLENFDNSIILSTYIFYIAIAYYLIFYIVEIFKFIKSVMIKGK